MLGPDTEMERIEGVGRVCETKGTHNSDYGPALCQQTSYQRVRRVPSLSLEASTGKEKLQVPRERHISC